MAHFVTSLLNVLLLTTLYFYRLSDAVCTTICDRSKCPAFQSCSSTVVLDLCSCCPVCGRTEGEACGGDVTDAVCSPGLVCKISLQSGRALNGSEHGTCEDVNELEDENGAIHRMSDCDRIDCPVFSALLCPEDSMPHSHRNAGDCCPQVPECKCLPCFTSQMVCKSGLVKVLLGEGTGLPGQCCHRYECQDKETACKNVSCEENGTEALYCPADSVPLPSQPTHSGCCLQHQGCECKASEECVVPQCGGDTTLRLTRQGTGMPGSCCDSYDCFPQNDSNCLHQDDIRRDGEIWRLDTCKECECRRGLVVCSSEPCPHKPPPGCSWVGAPEGHCCPECKGCVDEAGQFHVLGATWNQDPCVTCSCSMEGQVYCQAQICALQCPNPRTIPGECCPVCDEDPSGGEGRPLSCPDLASCSLLCESGLMHDDHGCPMCACQEEIDVDCEYECLANGESSGVTSCNCENFVHVPPLLCPSLVCPFGYKRDPDTDKVLCTCLVPPVDEVNKTCQMLHCEFGLKTDDQGATICECKDGDEREDIRCASVFFCDIECAYGYQLDENGCLACQCRQCPDLRCSKHCVHGYRANERGCNICRCLEHPQEAASTVPIPVLPSTYCMSTEGHTVNDGQLWYDGCRRCFCNRGQEMCAPVACPAPRCHHPVIRVGDCCPSCPDENGVSQLPIDETDCRTVSGMLLVEGETWQLDTCTQCICHQGQSLCQVEHCPPLLCSHPVLVPGSCCAVCPEDIGLTPAESDPYARRICESASGSLYTSGESWRVSACQSCSCQHGRIHCFSQTCPILSCVKTLLRKGQCCPTCLDTEYVIGEECHQNGEVYSVGESWLSSPCTQCICYQSQSVCAQVPCSDHLCPHPVTFPGQCCSTCATNTSGSGRSKDEKGKTENHGKGPPASGSFTRNDVIIAVLATLIVVLVIVVILLAILLLRRRSHRSSSCGAPDIANSQNGDIVRRPKSTNLDYKGINPLLSSQEPRLNGGIPLDPEKVPLDNSYGKVSE